ncbi:hypothetical protein H5410_036828, partial [Solanum commersonii]
LLPKGSRLASRPVVWTTFREGVHVDALGTWEASPKGQDTALSSRGTFRAGVTGQGTRGNTTNRGAFHGPSKASLSQWAKVVQPWQLLPKGSQPPSRPLVWTTFREGVRGDALDTWEARSRGQDTAPRSWQVREVTGQGTMGTTTKR